MPEEFNVEQEAAKLKETLDKKVDKTDLVSWKTTVEESVNSKIDETMEKAEPELRKKMMTIVNELLEEHDAEYKKEQAKQFDPDKIWTVTETGGNVKMVCKWNDLYRKKAMEQRFQKAVDDLTGIPGAPQDAGTIWTPQTGGNKFRPYISIQQIVGDSFAIVKLDEFAFETRANSKAAFDDTKDAAESIIAIGTHELLHVQSMPSIDDVGQYIPMIETAVMRADGKLKGAKIFDAIKASSGTTNGFEQVNTGVAATLPVAGDAIGKLADLSEAIGTDYQEGAVWHMARAVVALIRKATAGTGGDFAYDASTGTNTLWGQSIIPNDRMEKGNAANHVSVAYGNFMEGIVMGERVDLEIEYNPYTNPGNQTFYARTRFKEAINDTGAIACMRTKA